MKKPLRKVGSNPLLFVSIVAGSILPNAAYAQVTVQQPALVIQANARVTVTGGVTVVRDANLICNGQWHSSGGVVSFSGSNSSAIGGSGDARFYQLNLAKSQLSTVTLNTNLQIGKALNFANGYIDLNGRQLVLTDTAQFNNESDTSRIIGPRGGKIVISASGVDAPYRLNLGGLGAVLTSTDNLGALTIDRSPMAVSAGGSSIQRTYFIQPQNNSGLNVTLRFYYLRSELNGNDPSTLNLWKSTDGIGWSLVGADARDTANHYVEKSGLADLSYWTLISTSNPLPIKLVSFNALCTGNEVLVSWTTGSESQLDKFQLQRSANGTNWLTIGSIPAENAANGANYTFRDPAPQTAGYYRLQIIDVDGHSSYSNIFHGGCSDIGLPFSVYPNPAGSQAIAQISLRQACTGKVQVVNMAGQTLYETIWNLQPGINQLPLAVGGWASGAYLLRLVLPNGVQTAQLIKN